MISLDLVNESILELEQKDTSFANCERLAWLYTVKDHLQGYSEKEPAVIDIDADSEFLKVVVGKNPVKVWAVMNELAETIKVLYPNLYTKVLDELKEL